MTTLLRKFRNRLLLLSMIAISIVMIVSLVAVYSLNEYRVQNADREMLDHIESTMLTVHDDPGFEVVFPPGKLFIVRVDPRGVITVSPGSITDWPAYVNAVQTDFEEMYGDWGSKLKSAQGSIKIDGKTWLYAFNFRAPPIEYFPSPAIEEYIFLSTEDTEKGLRRLALSMFLTGIVVLAAFFFISRAFANRAMRPAVESFAQQRRFVADASHELKTPLAIIDANAEAALGELTSSGQADNIPDLFIGRIEEESGKMRELIDSLLYLTSVEDGADDSSEDISIDLTAAAEDEIRRIEAVLFEKGIGLEFRKSLNEKLFVKANQKRIKQAILVLLDNAVKYTDKGGKVIVVTGSVKRAATKSAVFSVTNTGAGISTEDLSHIFERFYRADKSRNSQGYGLGLSIAKAIVERSGGKINCSSESGSTTFTIELPLV